jgi:hypothetical protein
MLDAVENPHLLAAALNNIIDLDRLKLLLDVLLRDIVSRLPVKDAAHTAVLSHHWRPLCTAPSMSLVCSDPIFPMLFPKREIVDINDICVETAADELFRLTTQGEAHR